MLPLQNNVKDEIVDALQAYGITTCEQLLDHVANNPDGVSNVLPDEDLSVLESSLRALIPQHDPTPKAPHPRGALDR